jgi:hypothetical protein
VLLNRCCVDIVNDFGVLELTEFSVHSPIAMRLSIAREHVTGAHRSVTREYLSWKSDVNDRFRTELSCVVDEFISLTERLSANNVTQQSIDDSVNDFSSIIYKKSFDVFGKTTRTNTGTHGNRKTNPWFDERCTEARHQFHRARNVFYKSSTDENRSNFTRHRNIYNKVCRNAKIRHKVKIGKDLCSAVKCSPRSFWKAIKQFKKSKSKCSNRLTSDDFLVHFKELFGDKPDYDQVNDTRRDVIPETTDVDELDCSITEEGVVKAIHKLKCNKSARLYGLVSEVFKAADDMIVPYVTGLFNVIYDKGIYPTSWSKGVVVPVPKKANTDNVNSYRGITLMSVFGKLFSLVLSQRLRKWADANDTLTQCQFGFQAGKSTVDCVFIMYGIIVKLLSKGEKVYCAFVDFEKRLIR